MILCAAFFSHLLCAAFLVVFAHFLGQGHRRCYQFLIFVISQKSFFFIFPFSLLSYSVMYPVAVQTNYYLN